MVRALINWQVQDLLLQLQQRLQAQSVVKVEDVRSSDEWLAVPGEEVQKWKSELESFLLDRVYRHYRVQRMAEKGRRVVTELFAELCRAPTLLPPRYRRRVGEHGTVRTVCDYVAGMTDRYAQQEHQRLFQPFVSP